MKRQYYLDYAKCSAILFMITVHVLWKFGCDFEAPLGYTINSFFGGFMAAPVFMVAMGMGFAFTKTVNQRTTYIEGSRQWFLDIL